MKEAIENKKVLFGIMTVGLIFGIVIVSSFWPFILDPSRIMTQEFLSNELIITAIAISVTISVMGMAQASNNKNPASEISKARVEFKSSMARITNRTRFFEWVKKVYQEKDKKEIIEREMERLGVPAQAFYMEKCEILSLTERKVIGGITYEGYERSVLGSVLRLKKAVARIRFVNPDYYTSVKAVNSGGKTNSEYAKGEGKKKVLTIIVELATKIILTWAIASVFGSLVRDLTQEGGSTAQAWMDFLSRMTAFGSSCFSGWMIGCKLNDADAEYIKKRVEAHLQYLEDKTFVAECDMIKPISEVTPNG